MSYIEKEKALYYMGYKGKEVDAATGNLIEKTAVELEPKIKARYVQAEFEVTVTSSGVNLRNANLELSGEDIANHLVGCTRAVLFAATLGAEVDTLIRKLAVTDKAAAFAADALADTAIEKFCDEIEFGIREKKRTARFAERFSPGYGDLPLEIQPRFLELLKAGKRIGLCVSESLIMTPRKSVTAIVGIAI